MSEGNGAAVSAIATLAQKAMLIRKIEGERKTIWVDHVGQPLYEEVKELPSRCKEVASMGALVDAVEHLLQSDEGHDYNPAAFVGTGCIELVGNRFARDGIDHCDWYSYSTHYGKAWRFLEHHLSDGKDSLPFPSDGRLLMETCETTLLDCLPAEVVEKTRSVGKRQQKDHTLVTGAESSGLDWSHGRFAFTIAPFLEHKLVVSIGAALIFNPAEESTIDIWCDQDDMARARVAMRYCLLAEWDAAVSGNGDASAVPTFLE